MSGGVDSSVAAALMVEAGHDVVGLTMKLRDTTPEEQRGIRGSCCSPDDMRDARRVCDELGVPHYAVDYRDAFRSAVIEPFARSYARGETPNPCVLCNDQLKFATLLARARALGAERLITGHYARIENDGAGGWMLRRARDPEKDQSYFLFGLTQHALASTRFPLGDMTKEEVRAHGRGLDLHVADKVESEDICFVPDGHYARIVESVVGPAGTPRPGPIVDRNGVRVGEHRGIHHFTVGQRKGLGVSGPDRLFVLEVRGDDDTIVVGPRPALLTSGLYAHDCHWIAAAPPSGHACTVRIRHRHRGVPGRVFSAGDGAMVRFDRPEPAVARGQAAVFYDGDVVLGGGWIERATPAHDDLAADP